VLYYAAMAVMGAGPLVWAIAALVAFGAFLGFALFMTKG
jgi:hypothetical protein